MTAIPGKIKAQPDLFGTPPVSVSDRLEMAWQEWKKRKTAGLSVIAGVWDTRPEIVEKFGVMLWFPSTEEKQKCCKSIDDRDEALRQDPRKWEKHVMTYKHIACMFDVDPQELTGYARKRDRETQDGRDAYIFGATQK